MLLVISFDWLQRVGIAFVVETLVATWLQKQVVEVEILKGKEEPINWRCKQVLAKTPGTGLGSADVTAWVFPNTGSFSVIAFK